MRMFQIVLIVASSFVLITGQTLEAKSADASMKPTADQSAQKLRDVVFSKGVDLQFLIKVLARDLSLNVIFDPESRLENRRANIELRSVTTAAALDYILLQEGLYFEEAGPKTILVANRVRGITVPSIGVGTIAIGNQLAEYFGVSGGILISYVRDNSAASRAAIKAGDVIVGIDGATVPGVLGLIRAIDEKNDSAVTLTIVRDHESRTINVTPQKGIQSVL